MAEPLLPGTPVEDDEHRWTDLLNLARHYLEYRRGREALSKEEETLKKDLKDRMGVEEKPDEYGHRFLHFPRPMSGVTALKRERRVTQILDEDKAMEAVKKYGLEASCLETIVVLNEDGLLAANFEGTIPDDEMKAMYSEKEDFALVLVKEDQ